MAKRELASGALDPRKVPRPAPLEVHPSAASRLVLVLDIDNTLVHSAPFTANLDPRYVHLADDVIRFRVPAEPVTGGVELEYKVKLRKGLKEFLESAHEHYELAVYTHGSDAYAKEILRLIDPFGIYFGGRVVSRTEGENIKRLSLLLGGDRLARAVVVDDREDVWEAAARPCVQLVRPFHFFDSVRSAGRLMPGLPAQFERYVLADPLSDEQLHFTLMSTLRKVSQEMALLGQGAEVQQAMSDIRRRVLKGVTVVFAGGLIENEYDVGASPLWRFAEALGATCMREFDQMAVTHVVSGNADSNTVRGAAGSERHIHVVNPGWLLDCWYRTARVVEAEYPLEAPGNGGPLYPGQQPPALFAAPDASGFEARVEPTSDPRIASDPRLATRAVDPRLQPRVRSPLGADGDAAARPGSDGGAQPVAPHEPQHEPHEPQQQVAPRLADPRRRRAPPPPAAPAKGGLARGAAALPRIEILPPAMPLHELEAELDRRLCECVTHPADLETLKADLICVRNQDEAQGVREISLTRIIQTAGWEKIETIFDALGLYRPPSEDADRGRRGNA